MWAICCLYLYVSIISQVYDGASLMSGEHGGVQKLLQQKLDREIQYVHCYNHHQHLVVIHALAVEKAVMDFFRFCVPYCKFLPLFNMILQYIVIWGIIMIVMILILTLFLHLHRF